MANELIRREFAGKIGAHDVRFFNVVAADNGRILNQRAMTAPKEFTEHGRKYRIYAELRFDDQCNNGHETFSITGTIDRWERGRWTDDSCGCIHDEIAKHFPDLAPLIKWHLVSTDGPMYYIANTVYHAGDKDCHGLRAGEFRQHTSRGPHQNNGIEGVPNWELVIPAREARDVYATEKPAPVVCEWKPCGRTGDGKARDLEAARHSAVWPEATDAELCADDLADKLRARLPALMADFRSDMTGIGFIYPKSRD